MMKKYLIPESGHFYKANLHCHTTISDGNKTPEEVKNIYQDMGYSIVAYTDHDILIPHNELTDDKFLALHGFELEINEKKSEPFKNVKCCHICYIALDRDNITQPMWNESYLFGNSPKYKEFVQYDENTENYIREYNGECISEMMKIGREQGFFVTYNHPTWSRETYAEYINYHHMHAMEMFNGGCIAAGYEDYNPRVYDDILASDKKIFCIGADDNHNYCDINARNRDSGVAFTMIKADSLDYNNVTEALLKGHFYSSEGPSIYELWIEDDSINIKCSDADRILCTYQNRKAKIVYAENGNAVTSASFKFDNDDGYVRITVIDKTGKCACTNAYFI